MTSGTEPGTRRDEEDDMTSTDMTSTVTKMTTAATTAVVAAGYDRRLRAADVAYAREAVAVSLRPYMGHYQQWLVSPRRGESGRAYARRAARYAASRRGLTDEVDAALIASTSSVLSRI